MGISGGKDKQEKLLEQHHDPDSGQKLSNWSENFIDACDDKDVREGILKPENRRKKR